MTVVKDRAPRPEVEELSDLQWARIERKLWQQLDTSAEEPHLVETPARGWGARLRLRGLAIGGALALVAVVLLVVVWPGGEIGGGGEVVAVGGETPARVVTRASATTVSFAEAAIEVAPRSALLLSGSAERGATIVVEHGRAGFHVAPRSAQRPFVVVAGNAMVRVVGTRFEVSRHGESVEVAVREGKVDVRYLGQIHHVTAGGRWHSPVAEETAVLIDGGAPAGSAEDAERSGDPAGSGGAGGSTSKAGSTGDGGEHRRTGSAAGKEDRRAADGIDGAGERGSEPDRSAEERGKGAEAEASPTSSEAAALAAQFAAAARLESAAPQEALRRYLTLARRDDRWGSNALFAAARLALDVGERDRAAALARAYLRRFPRGLNAPDARALLETLP